MSQVQSTSSLQFATLSLNHYTTVAVAEDVTHAKVQCINSDLMYWYRNQRHFAQYTLCMMHFKPHQNEIGKSNCVSQMVVSHVRLQHII